MFSAIEQTGETGENEDRSRRQTSKSARALPRDRISLLGLIITLLALPLYVSSCDLVVQILSHGIRPESLKMHKGQNICFEDSKERIPLTLIDVSIEIRYQLQYYTADYELSFCTAPHECLEGNDTLSVNEGTYCFLTSKPYSDTIQNVCQECQDQSGGKCAHYAIARKKGKLSGVWRQSSNRRQLKFYLSRLDSPRQGRIVHSECDNVGTDSKDDVTLEINESEFDKAAPRSLLKYGDDFYPVESSEFGRPERGTFGDYQVSVDNRETLFASARKSCETFDSCSCNCSEQPGSMIGSFLSRKEDYKKVVGVKRLLKNDTLLDLTDSQDSVDEQILLTSDFIEMLVNNIRCKGGLWGSAPAPEAMMQTAAPNTIQILAVTCALFIIFAILGCLLCTQCGRTCLCIWCTCHVCQKCCCSSDDDSDVGVRNSSNGCCEGCFLPVSSGGDGASDHDGFCDCCGGGGSHASNGDCCGDGCCDGGDCADCAECVCDCS